MDDMGAVDGLARLGLTTYEARVFVALQKLGEGTASEVSEVTDVPRSQVYGAAEGLEDRGLVETQQSTPTVFRPLSLDRARKRLLDQIAETGAETFEYLESVQNSAAEREQSEAIWVVRGAGAIASRVAELATLADQRLLYGAGDLAMLDDEVSDVLTSAAADGLDVVVASAQSEVLDAVGDDRIQTYAVPADRNVDVATGRVLLADDDTILLSVFTSADVADVADGRQEAAFWSDGTGFAAVLVEFIEDWFAEPFDSGDR
jgi:sugar-specific transcriptional regulator TrmB